MDDMRRLLLIATRFAHIETMTERSKGKEVFMDDMRWLFEKAEKEVKRSMEIE